MEWATEALVTMQVIENDTTLAIIQMPVNLMPPVGDDFTLEGLKGIYKVLRRRWKYAVDREDTGAKRTVIDVYVERY